MQDTKVGMGHLYGHQVDSTRWANQKSKMAAIFQDGHSQNQVTSQGWNYLDELIYCGDNINVLRMLVSPINVSVLSEQHCKHSSVKKNPIIINLDKQDRFNAHITFIGIVVSMSIIQCMHLYQYCALIIQTKNIIVY